MVHFRPSTRFFASLTTLALLFVAVVAAPAHSAAQIQPAASTLSANTPPPVEYIGGIGGSLAGLAVNGTVAYIGEGSSLTVLDISDTAHPARVARLPLATLPADMVVAMAGCMSRPAARGC
jgi:hypothetical protein